MAKKSDEHYPLLLLYVEENGKRSEYPQRVVFADKGRGNAVAVAKGAAAIIKQWPAQVSSCWMTSIALGCSFIFLSLILLTSSITNTMHSVHVRCSRDLNHLHLNKTVHLIKNGIKWNRKQLELLKFIADTYSDFEIHSTVVETSMKKFQHQKDTKKIESQNEHIFNSTFLDKIFVLAQRNQLKPMHNHDLFDTSYERSDIFPLFHKRVKRRVVNEITYEDVLKSHSNIIEKQTTFLKYFANTPLQYFWMDLSPEVVIFAMRVQELWQDGGISFDLPHESKTKRTEQNNTEETNDLSSLQLLITQVKSKYDKMGQNSVSVDEQGLYMATRIPCHTFFGDVLTKLQKLTETTITVPDFIHKILNTYCCRGIIDSNYCKKH